MVEVLDAFEEVLESQWQCIMALSAKVDSLQETVDGLAGDMVRATAIDPSRERY